MHCITQELRRQSSSAVRFVSSVGIHLSDLQPETVVTTSGSLGYGVRVDRRDQPTSDLHARHGFDKHLLVIFNNNLFHLTQDWSGKRREGAVLEGRLALVPAGLPNRWAWQGNANTTHVRLPTSALDFAASELMDQPVHHLELRGIFCEEDRRLAHLVAALHDETLAGCRDPLYVDGLISDLQTHLIRVWSKPVQYAMDRTPAIDRRRMNRAIELMEARIDRQVTLDELANAAGTSRYWFCKTFRKTVGLAPHKFFLQLKLSKARRMLASASESLQEIAQQSGFADQAHLTRHFKAAFGRSPGDFRRGGQERSRRPAPACLSVACERADA